MYFEHFDRGVIEGDLPKKSDRRWFTKEHCLSWEQHWNINTLFSLEMHNWNLQDDLLLGVASLSLQLLEVTKARKQN